MIKIGQHYHPHELGKLGEVRKWEQGFILAEPTVVDDVPKSPGRVVCFLLDSKGHGIVELGWGKPNEKGSVRAYVHV